MQIHNGTINHQSDRHGNPQFHTQSWHHPEDLVTFHTSSAAVHWLWIIDEITRGAAARVGIVRED